MTIEILDGSGKVVRRYSSDDQPPLTPVEIEKGLIPLYWLKPFRKPETSAGMHRLVWDLHYTAPLSLGHEYPISAVPYDTPRRPQGIRAFPGQYTVRLTANGKALTTPLTIKMDPRVKITPAQLQQQAQLLTRLDSLLNQSSKAELQAKSISEQLEKLKPTGVAADAVKAFQKKLKALNEGDEANPDAPALSSLNQGVSGLYGGVGEVDAAPTATQSEAADTFAKQLPGVLQSWQSFVSTDVPALNQQLKAAGLPAINVDQAPAAEDAGMDQDEG